MYLILRSIAIATSIFSTLVYLSSSTFAQSAPPPGVIERTLPNPTEPSPTPSISPSPPPVLPSPPPQNPPNVTFPQDNLITIKKIEVLGSTVLKDKIADLVKSLEQKRQVTFEQLVQLRSDITELYIKNGYVTSGAFLPNNQNLNSGIIEIQVVEGELEGIELSGLKKLQAGYVRSRLKRAASTPLNQKHIEEALQLLQLDPLISRVNAELTAGSTPGRNILQVIVKEAPIFHSEVFAENNQSPSIGSAELGASVSDYNLLGFGDRLNFDYGITEGLNIYNISYTIPVNSLNGTLGFRYNNSDSRVIEAPFQKLNIKSEIETYSLNLRQPLNRSPTSEFALGLALDLRRNQTFIQNNIPYSFSEGPSKGKSNLTIFRFYQDWFKRNANRVLAARSQFSVGVDAFDATTNNIGTDGRFFSWLGQFQWVQQLSPKTVMLARLSGQLTPDSLLSIEKFSVGGLDTVRGYRQNQLVTDNGIVGSVEIRFPPISNYNAFQVAPFFEVGTAWNNRESDPRTNTIASLGLGLIWQPSRNLNLRLDYGIPLIDVNNRGDTLQDNGLFFSLRYQPF
ncbi:MAG: ShlB/FhaC/HecB family hemolysin secretion/activation protein [Stigonema ocellatum SAG 48.90 = DSM 106950]|nr:ShlB/FhaC/HecB family hemolysin secretion/activation protein [Stigonema ocellatum SAG 48.90 = DSM 106950]